MNINDLTIGQVKEINKMNLFCSDSLKTENSSILLNKKVIVRTYSAGAWFGTLKEKNGTEVILSDARRLWKYYAISGICLSAVAQNGIDQSKSRISQKNPVQWLDAIEIIPCSSQSICSIEGAENAKP